MSKIHPLLYLSQVFSDQLCCDLLIKNREKTFQAHKLVVASSSSYLRSLLVSAEIDSQEMTESHWPAALKSTVYAPDQITCSSGVGRTLDYYLVSNNLKPAILEVDVLADAETMAPHPNASATALPLLLSCPPGTHPVWLLTIHHSTPTFSDNFSQFSTCPS